eukprot:3916886-Amphidinium_carterae.1
MRYVRSHNLVVANAVPVCKCPHALSLQAGRAIQRHRGTTRTHAQRLPHNPSSRYASQKARRPVAKFKASSMADTEQLWVTAHPMTQ